MSVHAKQVKMAAQCFVQWLLRDNFKTSDLLPADKVPEMFREPYVYTGYRPLYRSWKYYVHSILHLHNETVNIWSHVIGFFIILLVTGHVLKDLDVTNDVTAGPVITFSICSLILMVFSSIAHLLHSKSTWHHQLLFLLDYMGISVHGFGVGVGSIYICSSDTFRQLFHTWYHPANFLISLFVFFLYCTARVQHASNVERRKSLMLLGTSIHGFFLFTPVIPRYTACMVDADCSLTSLNHISIVILLDVLCAVTFASLLPERWIPGRCDLVGHSHQIFHVFAVMTMVAKLYAMKLDINDSDLDIPRHIIPSLETLLWSLGALLFLLGLTLRYFLRQVKPSPASRKAKRIK